MQALSLSGSQLSVCQPTLSNPPSSIASDKEDGEALELPKIQSSKFRRTKMDELARNTPFSSQMRMSDLNIMNLRKAVAGTLPQSSPSTMKKKCHSFLRTNFMDADIAVGKIGAACLRTTVTLVCFVEKVDDKALANAWAGDVREVEKIMFALPEKAQNMHEKHGILLTWFGHPVTTKEFVEEPSPLDHGYTVAHVSGSDAAQCDSIPAFLPVDGRLRGHQDENALDKLSYQFRAGLIWLLWFPSQVYPP